MKSTILSLQKGLIKSSTAIALCLLIGGTATAQEKPSGSTEAVSFEAQSTDGMQSTQRSASSIVFYPNPSDGVFYIATEEKFYVQIYDRMMRPLLNREELFFPGKHVLDLNHIGTGYYIAQIETDTGMETRYLTIR